MLSPAISLLGVFIAAPMALTIWLAFQEWSTETGFGEARRTRQFSGDLWVGFGRPRLQGRSDEHGALHARIRGGDFAAIDRTGASRLSAAGQGRRHASDDPVLDLYGADGRGRACLVEALFAQRRPDQPDTRLGRPATGAMALIAGHGAGLDRDPECLAAGRLFHGAGGGGAYAGPRLALRGGGARRRRSAAALRPRDPAAPESARCSSPP